MASTVFYAAFSLLRHSRFATAEDLTIFYQAVRAYSRAQTPTSTIKASAPFNLLGDHFSPVVAVLAPLIWLWDDPRVILLAQAALFGAAVGVYAHAAEGVLGQSRAAASTLALALSWGVVAAVAFDFHEIAFAMPVLALSLAAYLREDWLHSGLWALGLCFVKEDLCLTAAAIGALLFFKNRRIGTVTGLVGVAAFGLITAVVIPSLSYWGRYTYWAAAPGGRLTLPSVIHRTLEAASSGERWHTTALVLLPGLIICFRSPILTLLIPGLAIRFLSEQPLSWSTRAHYSATAMIVVFFALLDGVRRSVPSAKGRTWIVVTSVLLAMGLAPAFPLRYVLNGSLLRCKAHCRDADAAVSQIPSGSSVMADAYLTPHLASRTTVYQLLPTLSDAVNRPIRPHYAVVDENRQWSDGTLGVDSVKRLELLGYRIISRHGAYVDLAWQGVDVCPRIRASSNHPTCVVVGQ